MSVANSALLPSGTGSYAVRVFCEEIQRRGSHPLQPLNYTRLTHGGLSLRFVSYLHFFSVGSVAIPHFLLSRLKVCTYLA